MSEQDQQLHPRDTSGDKEHRIRDQIEALQQGEVDLRRRFQFWQYEDEIRILKGIDREDENGIRKLRQEWTAHKKQCRADTARAIDEWFEGSECKTTADGLRRYLSRVSDREQLYYFQLFDLAFKQLIHSFSQFGNEVRKIDEDTYIFHSMISQTTRQINLLLQGIPTYSTDPDLDVLIRRKALEHFCDFFGFTIVNSRNRFRARMGPAEKKRLSALPDEQLASEVREMMYENPTADDGESGIPSRVQQARREVLSAIEYKKWKSFLDTIIREFFKYLVENHFEKLNEITFENSGKISFDYEFFRFLIMLDVAEQDMPFIARKRLARAIDKAMQIHFEKLTFMLAFSDDSYGKEKALLQVAPKITETAAEEMAKYISDLGPREPRNSENVEK